MKDISVVVCTKNEERFIGDCLIRLKRQVVKPEIVVVDAHSKDRTLEVARKYADKIVFDDGKGIASARNIGWKSAEGDIVAYCDADVRPPKKWTKEILKIIDKHGCVSGPLRAYDGSRMLRFNFNLWADVVPTLLAKMGYHSLWGANMAFEKCVLKKNPFRTKFLEDYELGSRLRKMGLIYFSPRVRVFASTRRFDDGFYRVCLEYIANAYRIKRNKEVSTRYWKKEHRWAQGDFHAL